MAKVCHLSKIVDLLRRDTRVIFSHGVFDLFHIGHLYLLKHSAKLGGKLVVGVDRDGSVESYKGRRPVFNEQHRLELIAQLDCVDYVFFVNNFGKNSNYFLKLYSILRPSLITYGANFSGSQYYLRKMQNECGMLDISTQQIIHRYSDLNTEYYLNKIRKSQ